MCLDTADKEEKDQCNKMHAIINDHGLDGEFRWLVAQKDPVRNGELYRYIAGMHAPRHFSSDDRLQAGTQHIYGLGRLTSA